MCFMKIRSYFVKIKENITKLYNKNKKLLLSVIALIVVIVGYLFFVVSENKPKNNDAVEEKTVTVNHENYEEFLERKIEKILLDIDEVSSAKVMVVCESSAVYHYLKNVTVTENGGDKEGNKTLTEEAVFEKEGSNSKAIIERYDLPKVVGVMVVVGGISPSTKLAILNSISVVLNVSSECISIIVD